MAASMKVKDCRRAIVALASAPLLLLLSCSQPSGSEMSESNLLTALPSPYSEWETAQPIGSCGIEAVTASDGTLTVRGWGVINASTGEVPEAAIFTVNKDGSDRFLVADLEDRNDVATRLNNPKLMQSGFMAQISASEVKLPVTFAILLGFQNKLFACEHKLDVR